MFHCNIIGEVRDLRRVWLDKMTGIPNTHIAGNIPVCRNMERIILLWRYSLMFIWLFGGSFMSKIVVLIELIPHLEGEEK
ncbi:hypothetical protein CLOSTHATH_06113 [Hungatella hathewayi DSM 13479]|uniref:Uncharacterized protein n=1 Tax=Hungatella hathewayi DSM 13479 TaxID=566550 RepID=D3AR57_9FIRM|nr:hypothetical protein CLOSTHATH_06113 [Hungatella hathewayi DSM 13479]